MPAALIALGSNLGDRQQSLESALQRLAATPGVQSVRASTWHATHPVGGPSNQPQFLNGAALIGTSLSPQQLLARLQQIEHELGRQRPQPWAPRTIDLDLLLFDQLIERSPSLTLPHPRMAFRRFVLEPACEVAPAMLHPLLGRTIQQLLHHLNTALPYVAISTAGLSPAAHLAADRVASAVAQKTNYRYLRSDSVNAPFLPLDSPSLTPTAAIEFLRQQAELLSPNHWPANSPGTISNFWIEDVLAQGDIHFPGQFDLPWQSISSQVVPPKLLVMFAAQPLPENSRSLPPVLWLESSDFNRAEAELLAAIQSMN